MLSYANGTTIDLLSLIPKCGSCLQEFDTFLHAPQILPCCHTFCLMCISKNKQRKKKRCILCKEKYSRFVVNTAYLVLIARVHAQRRLEERVNVRCEECDKRLPITFVRRCATCENEIQKIIADTNQTCCVCLECCVDRHNGHHLYRITAKTTSSSNNQLVNTSHSNEPRHQVFVRRSLGSTSATRTPSTRLASTASSSSETNSLSHRSSLRANQKCEDTHQSSSPGTHDSSLKSSNRFQAAVLAKRLKGLCKHSEKKSTDLEVSLDNNNAKCCIENYEYFQAVIHDTPPVNSSNPLKNGSSIGDCRVSKSPSSTDEKRMKPTESTTHKQLSKTNHTNSTLSNNHAQTNGYIPNMPRRNGFRGLPNTSYTDQQVNNGLSDGEKLFDSQILPIMVRAERVNQHSNDEKFFDLNRKKAYSNSDETSIGIDNFMKTKDDEQTRSASFLHGIASQCASSSNEHSSTRHNETDRRNAINSAEGSLHNYENVDVELKLPNELSISTGH